MCGVKKKKINAKKNKKKYFDITKYFLNNQ